MGKRPIVGAERSLVGADPVPAGPPGSARGNPSSDPPQPQNKKLYYVRLTLEEAADDLQPSPVNFPAAVHEMRLGGPLHLDSARCVYGDLDVLLEKLRDGST
jgi:hypothetical protein